MRSYALLGVPSTKSRLVVIWHLTECCAKGVSVVPCAIDFQPSEMFRWCAINARLFFHTLLMLSRRLFVFCYAHPLIAVSFDAFGSTSSALPIQRTLLHRMRTWPNVPELTPPTNSSVFESWMFMYRSTETSLPLYSVSPHFKRTTISLSTLFHVSMDSVAGYTCV
jgi:hypothetical protein